MLKTSRRQALGAFAIGTLFTLTACSGSDTKQSASGGERSSAAAPRVVRTDQGEVTVPADPKRVVVLNYALAGYLYGLDVPVVGITSEDFDKEPSFSELWGDAPTEDGTEILSWGMDGFSLEEVLALKPDLIVAGGVGFPNALAVDSYDQLSQIAPTVIVGQTLATWQEQLSFLAVDVLDRKAEYQEHVEAYEERLAEVREAITIPATPVATITVTADGTPYLLFEDQGLPAMLGELGFTPAPLVQENGLEPYTENGDMAELSSEQAGQLLAEVPVLFVTGFNADTTDVATLAQQPVWAELASFAAEQAYDLPYWAVRADYDETMALLDLVEQQFS